MTERQPEPYGHDALDTRMDDLIRAVRQYLSLRILEEDGPIGPSYGLTQAAEAVKEARRALRAHVMLMLDANND